MSSTHASWRNPAFFMREASSRFWRTDTSRSTSSPSRSSKERTWYSDNWPCSLRASLIPVSLRARSLSRVGCSSMSVLLHVISGGVLAVVVGTAQVFVQQRRLLLLGCGLDMLTVAAAEQEKPPLLHENLRGPDYYRQVFVQQRRLLL